MSRIIIETNNIFTKPKRISSFVLDEDVSEYLKEEHKSSTVSFLYRDCPVRINEGRVASFYADDFIKIREELVNIIEASKKKKKMKKETITFDASTSDLVVENDKE